MEKNWENFLCMFAIEYVSLFYVVKCIIDFCVYLHFFSCLFFIACSWDLWYHLLDNSEINFKAMNNIEYEAMLCRHHASYCRYCN